MSNWRNRILLQPVSGTRRFLLSPGFERIAASLRGRQDLSIRGRAERSGHRRFRAALGTQVPSSLLGDLHQPLHAADDHDAGANKKLVSGEGLHPSNLHHYWDVQFVERLGTDPRQVAAGLIGQISEPQWKEWSSGTPADWAMEAFALCRHPTDTTHIRCRRRTPSKLSGTSRFSLVGRAFGLRSF
jgi:hypothetical protein